MLTQVGGVKLLDFGLAKAGSRRRRRQSSSTVLPTQARRVTHGGNGPRHVPVHGSRAARRAKKPTRAPTSSRSAPCCTRWPPAGGAFAGASQAIADRRDPARTIRRRSPRSSRSRRRRSIAWSAPASPRTPKTAGSRRTTSRLELRWIAAELANRRPRASARRAGRIRDPASAANDWPGYSPRWPWQGSGGSPECPPRSPSGEERSL